MKIRGWDYDGTYSNLLTLWCDILQRERLSKDFFQFHKLKACLFILSHPLIQVKIYKIFPIHVCFFGGGGEKGKEYLTLGFLIPLKLSS